MRIETLSCPDCGIILLARRQSDIDIDVCTTCNGVWFDKGELESLAQAGEKRFGETGTHRFTRPDGSTAVCPRCAADTLEMGVIDKREAGLCKLCQGVWICGLPSERRSSPNSLGSWSVDGILILAVAILRR